MRKNHGRARSRTCGSWVRSANATSVLGCPQKGVRCLTYAGCYIIVFDSWSRSTTRRRRFSSSSRPTWGVRRASNSVPSFTTGSDTPCFCSNLGRRDSWVAQCIENIDWLRCSSRWKPWVNALLVLDTYLRAVLDWYTIKQATEDLWRVS